MVRQLVSSQRTSLVSGNQLSTRANTHTVIPRTGSISYTSPSFFLNIVCPEGFESVSNIPVKVYIHGGCATELQHVALHICQPRAQIPAVRLSSWHHSAIPICGSGASRGLGQYWLQARTIQLGVVEVLLIEEREQAFNVWLPCQ